MKQVLFRILFCCILFVGAGIFLTVNGQRKVITFYGNKCWVGNQQPVSTPIKEIKVVFINDKPVSIIRLGKQYELSWENSGDDYEQYSADENRYFSFRIADDKSVVLELYDYPGTPTYTDYTRNPTVSYDGGGNYNGGYNGGNFNNGGYNNDNRSRSSNSDQLTCPDCHGSGKCTSCAGRGEKRFDGRLSDCAICNGRGTCRLCYGRGWIR